MNNSQITNGKISALFSLRKLVEFADVCNAQISDRFWEELRLLQAAIYRLDAYYESHREISNAHIMQCWVDINDAVSDLAETSFVERFTLDIHAYERIEYSFRDSGCKDILGLRHYYGLKTCDVRMSRHILLTRQPSRNTLTPPSSWSDFDLIGEVLDDVIDVWQDIDNFNGNRFILGCIRDGVDVTIAQYRRFVVEVRDCLFLANNLGKGSAFALGASAAFEISEITLSELARLDIASLGLSKAIAGCALRSLLNQSHFSNNQDVRQHYRAASSSPRMYAGSN